MIWLARIGFDGCQADMETPPMEDRRTAFQVASVLAELDEPSRVQLAEHGYAAHGDTWVELVEENPRLLTA